MSDPSPSIEEEVLTDLAHKLVDQVALYGLAKDIADDPTIVAAIQSAKDARAHLLQDISAKIWQGGLPSIEQTAKLGTAHKAFLRLKSVAEKDNRSAVEEVERGEIYLKERVERAVGDERLTPHTRNYLQTVLSRLSETNDEISQLRQQMI